MQSSIQRVYGLIWGPLFEMTKTMIKKKMFYCIWLLKNLKLITSGLDIKRKERFNNHEALMLFLTMRQGSTESNDSYTKCFTTNIQTKEMSWGTPYFHIPEMVKR